MEKYYVLDRSVLQKRYPFTAGSVSPYDLGIPLVDISDRTIEEIYYFRFHTYCKHIKETPDGWVVTEFLPDVPWAGKHNTICCPAAHHLYEGRWFHDKRFLDSYAEFWCLPGSEPGRYSFWIADSIYAAACVSGDFSVAEKLYEKLKAIYLEWDSEKRSLHGLYYQIDDRDGMEYSAGGSGLRPTINSYMYGDAKALEKIANRLGIREDVSYFRGKTVALRQKINSVLWDEKAVFYKTLNVETNTLVPVRELIGYVPWYFNIPEEKMSEAWRFLLDEDYFYAPYGPTTAERNYRDFMKEFPHECLWNGPSWPFATSQTLTALGNLLCGYGQHVMTKKDYYKLLHMYANCHYLEEDGKRIPFIDENIDPFTGEWLARKILKTNHDGIAPVERGKDYNHSTFCDLVLSGLAGIRPVDDDTLVVDPLFDGGDIDHFCADGILYHGRFITVLWDRSGKRYGKGKGYKIWVDGEKVFDVDNICRFTCSI